MADWDLSCPDWEVRLREGRSLVPDLPLDRAEADRAIAIFNNLHIPDVVGKPAMSEAAGDWYRDILAALFGSIDPATGERRVRGVFTLVPKKNSKTTNGAATMTTALLMNRRPLAEFILTAPSQEIAEKAFSQAKGMIESDPQGVLQKRLKPRDHLKIIEDLKTGAKLKIKTFDESIVTGAVPVGVLIDELHVLGKSPRAGGIIGQLRGGMISVPEAFFVMITTQSDEPPQGVFKAELAIARAIRDGKAAVDTLPVLYEFSEAQQKDEAFWKNPANWPLVTPNLNRSVRLSRLVRDFEEASLKGEKEIGRWASQHLNIQLGIGLHYNNWAGAEHWMARGDQRITLESLLEQSEVVVMGIDGGGLDDLLGVAVIGRERDTKRWLIWCRAWASKIVLKRRQEIAAKLQDLAKTGDLIIIDSPNQDIDQVAEIAEQVLASGKLADKNAVGLDPAGIGAVVDALAVKKIAGDLVVGISQGWKLSGAIKTAERKLLDGSMVHGGQELMAWCVGNAKTVQVGNALTINKAVAGTAKIDPLMALFDAVSLMSMNPTAQTKLQYQMVIL